MLKFILLVLPLVLLSCANTGKTDELSVADQTELWIDSWAVVKGETEEQTRARGVPLPENAEYEPEAMKVIVSHIDDERPCWAYIAAGRGEDVEQWPDNQWPIGFVLLLTVRDWLPEIKKWGWVPGGMEYMRSDKAFVQFIKECDYDLETMRAKYKADLAKEKLENKSPQELED